MTLSELGSLGEAISGFAVVVSLLYVAYELRANTRTMRATSAAQGQDSVATFNEAFVSDPDLAELFVRAAEQGTLEDLTPGEAHRVTCVIRALAQRYESMYFRYEAGLLEERVWAVRRNWMAGFLKTPLGAEWWSTERQSLIYTGDFIEELERAPGGSIGPLGTVSASQTPAA